VGRRRSDRGGERFLDDLASRRADTGFWTHALTPAMVSLAASPTYPDIITMGAREARSRNARSRPMPPMPGITRSVSTSATSPACAS
jgi:hypothetical protein